MAISPRPSVAVVGSINTDLVVYARRLPLPGETIIGGDLLTGHGGKGANQAVAAARLGADVRFVARVGDDPFGRNAVDALLKSGVDVSSVSTTAATPAGVALIVVDERGENLIAIAPGANARVTAADVDAAWPRLASCRVLLLQFEVPMEANVRAAQLARDIGMLVVLNPAPAPDADVPSALFAAVDVLVPNETEARALSGIPVTDTDSSARAAAALRQRGPRVAIVTLGKLGALIADENGVRVVPAMPVTALDTTGAGDAFCGGLAVALAEGASPDEATRFATAVAALAVTAPGAQEAMPTLAAVKALRAKHPGARC